jgi:iodotyrosine deiodinase
MLPRDPLLGTPTLSDEERLARVHAFEALMRSRRTVRDFAATPVPRAVIESAIRTAATAPNGANKQPWSFVAVSDPAVKHRIREAAEAEEQAFYGGRAPQAWLDALAPIGTDAHKPFLETAPWLIAVFAVTHGVTPDGGVDKHYYVQESVGIAVGMLLGALHAAGLATLTHTPSPMNFLRDTLGRPERERAFVLIVTGHPAADATVPRITKKRLDQVATFVEAG